MVPLDATEFIDLDHELETGDQLTDDQILELVKPSEDSDEDSDGDGDMMRPRPVMYHCLVLAVR